MAGSCWIMLSFHTRISCSFTFYSCHYFFTDIGGSAWKRSYNFGRPWRWSYFSWLVCSTYNCSFFFVEILSTIQCSDFSTIFSQFSGVHQRSGRSQRHLMIPRWVYVINLANFVHSTFMNLMRMRSFSFSITHLHVASEFKCLFWYVERGAADIQYFF